MTPILQKMEFSIRFDRPVNEKHYIIPGGYTIKADRPHQNNNGRQSDLITFDFCDEDRYIDETDPCVMHFQVRNLDPEYGNSNEELNKTTLKTANFSEFFVYTGEDDDPEIKPVQICTLAFIMDDGTAIGATLYQREQASGALATN